MNRFIVVASMGVTLPADSVISGLTKNQVARRSHLLAPDEKRKTIFRTNAPVSFKNGESFSFDGDLPKNLAEAVGSTRKVDSDKAAADKAAADKAAADKAAADKAAADKAAADKAAADKAAADKAAADKAAADKAAADKAAADKAAADKAAADDDTDVDPTA